MPQSSVIVIGFHCLVSVINLSLTVSLLTCQKFYAHLYELFRNGAVCNGGQDMVSL